MTISIRDMTAADTDGVAEVRVLGWRYAYRGLMPQGHLDALDPAPIAAGLRQALPGLPTHTSHLVASAAGRVVGWACQGPYRPEDDGWGEVRALYVRPDVIGAGVGRALLAAGTGRLRAAGLPRVRLWVLRGNLRARRFYERAGFAADGAVRSDDVDGARVPEVRYARG
ncbi:GNAT family N-acetyltransferase [Streptomyces sp. NPDC059853]|uniref:GNAT family N-acetyltransferase n=1 Tax=Streptomyces sp. NPDC059853 TaxID=3346973 RepID=UPI003666C4E1